MPSVSPRCVRRRASAPPCSRSIGCSTAPPTSIALFMKQTDIARPRIAASEPEVRLDLLYTPFLRRWRLVALCVLGAWAAALALILIPKREYRAQMVVAAVPNAKSASLAGGISSLLGNATLGGVQSTPYFITRLLLLRGVLREVALSPAGDGTKATVIERVLEEPRA